MPSPDSMSPPTRFSTSEQHVRARKAATHHVFVGGLHRSGTSLVARMLSSAEGATGLVGTGFMEDEGHYLHEVVPSVKEFGGPGRFAFDDRAHLTDPVDGSAAQIRTELLRAWQPYWGDPEARVHVEKSPQNLLQSRLLQAAFPDASFIMVVRHPAAVALATRKWTGVGPPGTRRFMPKRSLHSLLDHWIAAHDRFAADRVHLRDVTVIRFEDLVADPSIVTSTMFDALGVTPRPNGARPPAELDPTYRLQWRRWLASPIGRMARDGWLADMAPAFERWGYTIDGEF